MEFSLNKNIITIYSEKKDIILKNSCIDLDGLTIEYAWEYEKSGILMYVREYENIRYYHFRVEGLWVAYIPQILAEIPSDILDFFGQIDILVAPCSKNDKKIIEQLEPRMLISYHESASDLIPLFGPEISLSKNYKLKTSDISTEKTSLVILSE